MLAIRLRRAGSKKRPFFRVVVADARAARDSSFVEILGHYNPRTKPAIVDVKQERVDYWLGKGAQPSDSVRTLIARHLHRRTQPLSAPGDSMAPFARPGHPSGNPRADAFRGVGEGNCRRPPAPADRRARRPPGDRTS